MTVLINIDVPDLVAAERFYSAAFGLRAARRLGRGVLELSGWDAPVYLLECASDCEAAARISRTYQRHWTPIHLDIVVPDIGVALTQAVAAGATLETGVRDEVWGQIATLADPFGHGFCLIAFKDRGYDEIANLPTA